tara:strand:+ start:165 stop:368 length:204 start_codon:yes stop_codon:yes gene_type:complete
MNKIILLIIGYAMVIISIIAYYKINNYRMPFTKWWLGYKPDVKKNERIILAFIIQIPLLIFILSNSI